MSTEIAIFDVSSMLYAGHCVKAYKYPSDTAGTSSVQGIPIGGIRYALKYVLNCLKRGSDVLLVFDSKTDKQREYIDYKGNRAANPAIIVQQAMLYDVATAIGLPCLKMDNYEADDLIATVVRKIYKAYGTVYIYTGDADIYANIISPNVEIVGSASIYPSVNSGNYNYIVKKNCHIQYNTILPYFAIYGKPSNNVPPFADGQVCNRAYQAFLHFVVDNNYRQGDLSNVGVFAAWLRDELEKIPNGTASLTEDQIVALFDRQSYIFPRIYEGNLDIKTCSINDLNNATTAFYFKALNLETLLLDLNQLEQAVGPRTREMDDFIAKYKSVYVTGSLAADEDTSADLSFFEGEPSKYFADEGDF